MHYRLSIRDFGLLLVATGAASLTACGGSPPATAVGPSGAKSVLVQEEAGSIALPLRFPLDATYSSYPGGQRQVYTVAGSNGHVGYTFELNEAASGGRFELEVTGGLTGREDIDITFYSSFEPVVSPGAKTERKVGGETGTIPNGSRFAIVTMFDGADVEFVFRGFTPEPGTGGTTVQTVALPPPGVHNDFGFKEPGVSDWAARLKSRSHVVIALVDTGINPYHIAYKRPEYAIHPSLYIEGFPENVPALGLTQDAGDYVSARRADDTPVWSRVRPEKLYWIPGTNVIGAYSVENMVGGATSGTPPPDGLPPRPIIDDHGHGTGVSSVAAGAGLSSLDMPYGSNPEALIVVVEGIGDEGVKWAAEQPWIDFISASYGPRIPQPCNHELMPLCGDEHIHTGRFVVTEGRTVCFAAGNGVSNTGVAPDRSSSIVETSGPSWVVTVGAVSPRNDQDYWWHSVPVDISSYGAHWPSAAEYSLDGEGSFGGTSNATPVTCGVFSSTLLAARKALGDAREGLHVTPDGEAVPAFGRPVSGLIGDGVLTRLELQDAVFKTAFPTSFDPESYTYDPGTIPDSPAYYTQEGYGVANVGSGKRAVEVVFGRAPMPDRSEVDAWIAAVDQIRDLIYPPPQ